MANGPNRTRWLRRSLRQAPRLPSRDASPEPSALAKTQIDRINEISLMARTTWFGLLAYLTFVGITLLGVEDADFFVPSRQTQLPLVNVSIPTADFFAFAPALGAALYTYLHIQLLKLWEALAAPDPVIAGRPLAEHVYPWLINDFALTHRRDGAIRRRPLVFLSNTVTVLLVWIAGPFVLAGFWIRSMPAHAEGLTLFIALCLGTAVYVGLTTWWRASKSLRCVEGTPWSGWWKRPMGIALLFVTVVLSWITTEGGLDHYANKFVTAWNDVSGDSWMRTCELRIRIDSGDADPEPPAICLDRNGQQRNLGDMLITDWYRVQEQHVSDRSWGFPLDRLTFDTRGTLFGFVFGEDSDWIPYAPTSLAGVDFVPKPSNWRDYQTIRGRFRETWCKQQGLELEVCARIHGAADPPPDYLVTLRKAWCIDERREIAEENCEEHFATLDGQFREAWTEEWNATLKALKHLDLSGSDLRGANLSGAFLAAVDLTAARMDGGILVGARLEGADLRGARMAGADLSEARLEGAILVGARLEGADLSEARLEGADLQEAWMNGVNLSGARMDRARLWLARLERADLSEARLERALLREAQLGGADVKKAWMARANLHRAQLDGADLSGARLEGAFFLSARMERTNLERAQMVGAFLEAAIMFDADFSAADLSGAQMNAAICSGAMFLAAIVHSADLTCRGLTQDQLRYTVGNADTLLRPGLHVWSCLDRNSLPTEVGEQIKRVLDWYPEKGAPHGLSQADFEERLFCDPNHSDPLLRSPQPVGRND